MNTVIFACVFVLLARRGKKGCDFILFLTYKPHKITTWIVFFSRKWSKMRFGLWKTTQTLLPATVSFLLMVAQKVFSCEYSHLHPGHTMCVYGPRECPEKQLFSETYTSNPPKNNNLIQIYFSNSRNWRAVLSGEIGHCVSAQPTPLILSQGRGARAAASPIHEGNGDNKN